MTRTCSIVMRRRSPARPSTIMTTIGVYAFMYHLATKEMLPATHSGFIRSARYVGVSGYLATT